MLIGCSEEHPHQQPDGGCALPDLSSPKRPDILTPPDLTTEKMCTLVPEWDSDKEIKTLKPACAALMVEEINPRDYFPRTDPDWYELLSFYTWASDTSTELTPLTLDEFQFSIEYVFPVEARFWHPTNWYVRIDGGSAIAAPSIAGGGTLNSFSEALRFTPHLELKVGEKEKHRISILVPKRQVPVTMMGGPIGGYMHIETLRPWTWHEPDGTAHHTIQDTITQPFYY